MEMLDIVVKAVSDKKGSDIVVYDFANFNPFIDKVVIATATNARQVYAISQNVVGDLRLNGFDIKSVNGTKDSSWILVDAFDVVVHIFLETERDLYKLDELYQDLDHYSVDV